jgi:hypothetical protein
MDSIKILDLKSTTVINFKDKRVSIIFLMLCENFMRHKFINCHDSGAF